MSQNDELRAQKDELFLSKQLITQQQFETTFFNMLNVHRQLKKDLKITSFDFFYRPDDITYGDKFSGVGVFEKIAEEYTEINNNLIHISYNLENISPRVIDEKLSDVFFLNHLQQDESNPDPITLAERLDSNWTENNNAKETHTKKIIYTYNLLYMNYQNILSHYCRNVYHILKFIRKTEEEDIYTKSNKTAYYKQYANILQSQLNVSEHFVLFYNFIWHQDNHEENEIYFPMNIINKYKFLENIGINNLILNNHKKQYKFLLKGDF